ncbi:NapC/NirT family cytochrome c [Tropicimonas isoalkanivorans]|uniref:Cytochrome c-type protein n=1 Tax=Tropicimonas isoalkanivorans TaxID=441112 RepID=A0A1I1KNZ5_9RHOB|nr:NapC/NirT family cytochrome c [Tropicimonas isoalkanivorans]SFC62305.1 trimethylamine-N-oxide reductase (cytochrome c), cytochrome c-type subunit TorC [Tropicimonas isoalkanivorans]
MAKFRNWLRGPSGALATVLILLVGIVIGAGALFGAHTAIKSTENTEFCVSCHDLAPAYAEYKESPHFSNASGVQAGCPDCHVPEPFGPMVIDHFQALGELYSSWKGTIDTPEKYDEHRLEMAERVWAYMEATDSRECRSCHAEHAMNFALQAPEAAKRMQEGFANGDTCIDCHKGIAHKLPDMSQGYKKTFEELLAASEEQGAKADDLYVLQTKPYYGSAKDAKSGEGAIGQILAATHLHVLDRDGDALKVKIEGWQQDGVDKVIYELRGQRIFSATAKADAVELISREGTETDSDTGLVWHDVSLEGWVDRTDLVDNLEDLWAYGAEMNNASCGVCHSAVPANHFLANQWIGSLKAMERFITLDKEQYRFLQKYLQMHASDTGGAGEH